MQAHPSVQEQLHLGAVPLFPAELAAQPQNVCVTGRLMRQANVWDASATALFLPPVEQVQLGWWAVQWWQGYC
jgi:hypothetical protein